LVDIAKLVSLDGSASSSFYNKYFFSPQKVEKALKARVNRDFVHNFALTLGRKECNSISIPEFWL